MPRRVATLAYLTQLFAIRPRAWLVDCANMIHPHPIRVLHTCRFTIRTRHKNRGTERDALFAILRAEMARAR